MKGNLIKIILTSFILATIIIPVVSLAGVPVPPPIDPIADANGPYVFYPQTQPWFLDGSGSVNPDEGLSEFGQPGDTIQEYAWELDGDNLFDDAFGLMPDVTAFYASLGIGDYLGLLRVTDTSATSFPSSGLGDLSDTDFFQVSVLPANEYPGSQPIPEPTTILLLGSGLVGLFGYRMKFRK